MVRLQVGDTLAVSAVDFADPDPGDELKLRAEWGDGTRDGVGCGPCRLEHVYASPGRFPCVVEVTDRHLEDQARATAKVSKSFSVEVGPLPAPPPAPVQYCHSITGATGACPTGAAQFCDSVPIVATSSSQAEAACNACEGAGVCAAFSFTGAGINGWENPVGRTQFIFAPPATTCGGTHTPSAGEILDAFGGGCPLVPPSRWAP